MLNTSVERNASLKRGWKCFSRFVVLRNCTVDYFKFYGYSKSILKNVLFTPSILFELRASSRLIIVALVYAVDFLFVPASHWPELFKKIYPGSIFFRVNSIDVRCRYLHAQTSTFVFLFVNDIAVIFWPWTWGPSDLWTSCWALASPWGLRPGLYPLDPASSRCLMERLLLHVGPVTDSARTTAWSAWDWFPVASWAPPPDVSLETHLWISR